MISHATLINRVFDFLLKEKASDVGNSLKGLLFAVVFTVWRPFKKDTNTSVKSSKNITEDKEPSIGCQVLAVVLLVVQALVLAIVLCPLAVLHVLGLYLSGGISLWRLIHHNFGNGDEGPNLKPALNVLYSLAVAQGVVYGYRAIYDLVARTGLVEVVADGYSLETDLVSEYLDETVAGCMKVPSFARGRNLVTYAVDLLMDSKSRYGYISAVLILGTQKFQMEQLGLIKQLLTGSASFNHVVQRLVETFGPRSSYSTEIRVRAAKIVAIVAGSIRLEQFPAQGMMTECISSLLDTFEEHSWQPEGYDGRPAENKLRLTELPNKECERGWLLDRQEVYYQYIDRIPSTLTAADSKTQGYTGLVVQGLCILQGLAVDEDNSSVICNTQGLQSKAMAQLMSYRLHSDDDHHDEWCSMAEESLELMKRLMATLYQGEAEANRLPSEISGNTQAIISTLKGILDCVKCQVLLKRQAIEVLLDLSVDDTQTPASIILMPGGSSSSSSGSKMFVWMLLHISLLPDYHFGRMCGSTHLAKKSSYIARLAAQKLQAMPRSVGGVICSLATAVADAQNNAHIRVHAATILKHLVIYYTKDDENLKQLKKAITDVMPEVLKEIVVHARGTREAGIQPAVTDANNGSNKVLLPDCPDIEQGSVPLQESSSSTSHQRKGVQLQEALIHLCRQIKIEYTWIRKDPDLIRQFNEIAAKICSEQGIPHKTFESLLYEALDKLREEEKRASRLAAVRNS